MNNTFLRELENKYNYKFTENMGVALKSTGSKVYDLFAFGGAYRTRTDQECIRLFRQAWEEDADLTLKCLFYLRDCRGGQGERRFFRVCLSNLARTNYEVVVKNLSAIPDKGRWDDLFCLMDTPAQPYVIDFIRNQLKLDMNDAIDNHGVSLLAKWMPSENTHSKKTRALATRVRKALNVTPKQYRKMLSKLRGHINVLEKLMSANRWDEIKFDKIPSKAGLIYRNTFARKDIVSERYKQFINSKKTKVNSGTLYPYEIVEKVRQAGNLNDIERQTLNKYWENLPNYLEEDEKMSMLCVVDTSYSMHGRPIDVAISLGIYAAERMTGPFANNYITFSRRPQLITLTGVDFVENVEDVFNCSICQNTDLTAVFDLLLNVAIRKNVRKEDIPKTIVVISDMEIDRMSNWRTSTAMTEMDKVREKWSLFGLRLPNLIYWNVNARHNTILDKGQGVSYVSGCSPSIFKSVVTGKNGIELMLDALLSERYKNIMA